MTVEPCEVCGDPVASQWRVMTGERITLDLHACEACAFAAGDPLCHWCGEQSTGEYDDKPCCDKCGRRESWADADDYDPSDFRRCGFD